jgi:hypothetical protein
VRHEGPDHSRQFFATVLIRGEVYGEGEGRSKKAAEQAAAQVAWRRLQADREDTAPPGTAPPGTAPPGTAPPDTPLPGIEPPGIEPPGIEPPGIEGSGTDPASMVVGVKVTGDA